MITFSKVSDTTEFIQKQKDSGSSVGFVPTMGALHQGHIELMKRAKKENDLLVVSIFVNPIQFNNPEDLEKYPRDLTKDKKLLEEINCDVLFAPPVNEMYPDDIIEKYNFGTLETVMEGASRPGHFNGVGVVVSKLFNICVPNKAYFGEKDYQQLAIIKKLVEMESFPVEIIACPTVRENDGLAMSSRNERLTESERASAPFIYEVLKMALESRELLCPNILRQYVLNQFSDRPEFNVEYFELADDANLQPVTTWDKSCGTIGFIAVNLGKVRLIDNIRII